MATKNFTQFNTATPLTTSDYIVGYNATGTAEIKTQVQSILNLKSDSDSQTLSFNESNKNLSITPGNTVSLSSFTTNTDFDSYKTGVASATATLLPITTYQSASGNWESTYTTFSFISAFAITTGGNTRTANMIIGTNDAYHLRFETNNSAKMTILSGGEVGIGTSITETASAGNGGLIVKNNLLVGGTTIKETANLTQPSIVNGNFQNIAGLTTGVPGWLTGVPFGWTSPNVSPAFAVGNESGDYVANLETLANTSGGSDSFRQNLGTLQVMSDVSVTFDYANDTIAPWSSGILNAEIYDGNFNILATSTHSVRGTYSLTAPNVPAGTTIIVGFWRSSERPALNNVTVTIANSTVLTVVGGVSASSIVTPKLQVQDGVVIFSNLPTLSANLPVGAVWNNNGALRIV